MSCGGTESSFCELVADTFFNHSSKYSYKSILNLTMFFRFILRENGMDISLFKRLSECHPHAVVHLEYQYRMHKHIMLLSNTLIYENRLKCATQEISETLINLPNFDRLRTDIAGLETRQQGEGMSVCRGR